MTIQPSTILEFDSQQSNFYPAEPAPTSLIPDLIGSSCFTAVSEDACKDEDNARWVLELETPIQNKWLQHLRWIRLIDRLAENELIDAANHDFQNFRSDWQTLLETGQVAHNTQHHAILTELRSQWFSHTGQPLDPISIAAWSQYLEASNRYHAANLEIRTFAEYEQMLIELGGSFFQVFPFLQEKYQQAASYFGVVDQFYNHLRDLQEDTQQGICYFPLELLNHFGVSKNELLDRRARLNPNYQTMMAFWLDEYLPRLRRKVRPLITAQDLHSSWQILCFWSIHRYRRIERVFRRCQFDYAKFPKIYWEQVQADMPWLLNQIKQPPAFDKIAWPYNPLEGWKKLVFIQQNELRSLMSLAN